MTGLLIIISYVFYGRRSPVTATVLAVSIMCVRFAVDPRPYDVPLAALWSLILGMSAATVGMDEEISAFEDRQ